MTREQNENVFILVMGAIICAVFIAIILHPVEVIVFLLLTSPVWVLILFVLCLLNKIR